MANLLGQNIGTNYKGILNLNTLNGNLTTTLQAVTDGDGNVSPLRLSTTSVDINSALTASGAITSSNNITCGAGSSFIIANRIIFSSFANGSLRITNDSTVGFNLLQLGGTTNAFPAIKRNGAGIDFRLADDSAFCSLNVGVLTTNGIAIINTARMSNINDANNFVTAINIANSSGNLSFFTSSLFAASGTINASARVQIDSTTQGFLPPRGSNAQMLAIASPATGLIFFDTTNNKLNCYDGTNWQPCW